MASTKSITVKVATAKVIKALEIKSAELAKTQALYTKEQEDNTAERLRYEKAVEKYQKDMIKAVLPHISKYKSGGVHYRAYNDTINVDVYIPAQGINLPTEPESPEYTSKQFSVASQLEEVNNAIRILKMTDEETVSTSTFNKIAQYL